MKALTIYNPFPAYILLPEDDPLHKRVENRTWATPYRGELLIHAGTNKGMMDPDESYEGLELHWGAIVGVCELVDCVQLGQMSMQAHYLELVNGKVTQDETISRRGNTFPAAARERFPWLATHEHAHGPVCWVLENIRKFPEPVRCRGAQGMWNVTGVPLVNVRAQLKKAVAV